MLLVDRHITKHIKKKFISYGVYSAMINQIETRQQYGAFTHKHLRQGCRSQSTAIVGKDGYILHPGFTKIISFVHRINGRKAFLRFIIGGIVGPKAELLRG